MDTIEKNNIKNSKGGMQTDYNENEEERKNMVEHDKNREVERGKMYMVQKTNRYKTKYHENRDKVKKMSRKAKKQS